MRNGLITDSYVIKRWFKNDKLHRVGGPAIECSNGTRYWCIDGEYHREDGPAIEYADGRKEWWYQGRPVLVSDQEEFELWIRKEKLKAFG